MESRAFGIIPFAHEMCWFAAEKFRLSHVGLMWPVKEPAATTEWYITDGEVSF